MSDEQRITKVEKEKDPRRVEACRRLGAISKAAKARKARDRQDRQDREDLEADCSEDRVAGEAGGIGIGTIIATVGMISCLIGLYYTRKQDRRAEERDGGERTPAPTPVSQSSVRSKIISLD